MTGAEDVIRQLVARLGDAADFHFAPKYVDCIVEEYVGKIAGLGDETCQADETDTWEYVCEVDGWDRKLTTERIVRCRDCKHSFEEGSGYLYCGRRPGHCFEAGPNGFCAWGVPKEGA